MADLSTLSNEELINLYNDSKSSFNKLSNQESSSFLDLLKPSVPIGMNIASGLMSLAGRNPEEKNIIRNLPNIATGEKPGIQAAIGQGIGEYLPLTMSGIGSATGLMGTVGRIGATSGYGAAVNPEDRMGGAIMGGLAGTAGEIVPGAIKGVGSLAEKINPVKFTQSKIREILSRFKEAESKQKKFYESSNKYSKESVMSDPLIKSGYHDPENFLGFDKTDLSSNAKDIYDRFVNKPIFGNLHKLQSQLFKDMKSFKNKDVNSYQKAAKSREISVEKAKDFLKNKDEKAFINYEKGAEITRDELKPYLETPELRKLISEKVTKMQPKQFTAAIKKILEKENTIVPEKHHLRNILSEMEPKLEAGQIAEEIVPEQLRKWSPNFVKLAQNPSLIEALKSINLGYQPLRAGITGSLLEK